MRFQRLLLENNDISCHFCRPFQVQMKGVIASVFFSRQYQVNGLRAVEAKQSRWLAYDNDCFLLCVRVTDTLVYGHRGHALLKDGYRDRDNLRLGNIYCRKRANRSLDRRRCVPVHVFCGSSGCGFECRRHFRLIKCFILQRTKKLKLAVKEQLFYRMPPKVISYQTKLPITAIPSPVVAYQVDIK